MALGLVAPLVYNSRPDSPAQFSFKRLPEFTVVITTGPPDALNEKLIDDPAVVLAVVTAVNFLFALVAKIAVTAKTRVAVVRNIFDFFIQNHLMVVELC
jgi:hypothetical protein